MCNRNALPTPRILGVGPVTNIDIVWRDLEESHGVDFDWEKNSSHEISSTVVDCLRWDLPNDWLLRHTPSAADEVRPSMYVDMKTSRPNLSPALFRRRAASLGRQRRLRRMILRFDCEEGRLWGRPTDRPVIAQGSDRPVFISAVICTSSMEIIRSADWSCLLPT